MLIINTTRVIYFVSVITLVFFINFSMELDSSFFILGGKSEDASNAVLGQFNLIFIFVLIGVSIIIFMSSIFFITTRNIYFLSLLTCINILFSFDSLVGIVTQNQIRVFDNHTFNAETDNWLKATNSDGILYYSISDLSIIFILLIISFAVVYKKKYLTSNFT